MRETTQELKQELKKTVGLLHTLRDEVRLKIHLAGMDAKDEWNKIEGDLEKVDREAEKATEAAYEAVKEMLSRVRVFQKRHSSH